jgi:diaminohydroxyphosphoribosylaminopyrimidine deaminase/5-amino-6-(5-phosphoribosylamino)uracil reductase
VIYEREFAINRDKTSLFSRSMIHEKYMQRCLQLAANGQPAVSPNPMVGAVIVAGERIIGEGYHTAWGQPHAEVMAIRAVEDRELLRQSVIYVSLEPCSHFGKTPPCADLIISSGIPEVVLACNDPFDKVNGSGTKKLEEAGIKVTTGVLEKEARFLNRRFFTFHEKQRPYIILKWARTRDGYMDRVRNAGEKGVNWITQPRTKQIVHTWRSEEQAIAIGYRTLLNDDPALDTREVKGRDPLKIIMSHDPAEDLSRFRAFNQGPPAHIIGPDPAALVEFCRQQQIISVLVEGGAATIEKFLREGLWDEARVFTGITAFTDGLKAPTAGTTPAQSQLLENGDRLDTYFNL